jgi:beta-glucosidase
VTLASAQHVEELLEQLTTDEKILLLEGVDSWRTNPVPRLGIPSLFITDGPHGVRRVRAGSGAFDLSAAVPSTAFPTSATLAATWSTAAARAMGAAIGRESAARGVHVLLAPGVNIKRNPLCGRNFEYLSEDPLVSGELGAAFVEGVQSEGVGTSVKHFAGNSNEDFRFVGDSLVDERALREIYLRAFQRIVTRAHPTTVMAAYNALNGTACSENGELLTTILRDEWGFDGVVMSDWGATRDRVAGLAAGLELDMPGHVPENRQAIHDALSDGRLTPDVLDEAVRRMLHLIERCGSPRGGVDDPEGHAALAQRIATEGAVLLQNDGTLPLSAGGEVLVVGELFERMRFQGAGSSLIVPPSVTTPKDAFDRRGVRYRYARGYRSSFSGRDEGLEREALDAAAAASGAPTVLFFGGLGDLDESEGFDRSSMALPQSQTALLEKLLDAGARVVLVLFAGAPVELPFADRLAAVLDMCLPGMRGGEAAAALLYGEANPSGRLAETWPLTAADASSAADYDRGPAAQYYESIYVGYRHYDTAGTPVRYPFGHGLSYTRFGYEAADIAIVDGAVEVGVTIRNLGDRDGAEIVQLYVRNAPSAVFKARTELRAFDRVELAAGASARVTLSFALADLAYWDVAEHGWVLENGEYEVLLAAAVDDVRARLPLTVASGRASRSPYPAAVDRDYAHPPTAIPASFPELLGRRPATRRRSRRLTTETRLGDARASVVGGILYALVVGRVRREYRAALALPDSPERDARVKSGHFLMRMMPNTSLRSMVMSSAGAVRYDTVRGLADIAAFHPIRGLRRILRARPRREAA